MITLRLSGGLGNQMFQCAAAMALAKQHDVRLSIDLSEFEEYKLREYMLDCYNLPGSVQTFSRKKTLLPQRIKKLLPQKNLYKEPHYHFDPNFSKCHEHQILEGYFQSERYFEDISSNIRKYFTLREKLSASSAKALQSIEAANISVALHVRRGDYVSDAKTQATHGSASEAYYAKAIKRVTELHGDQITFFMFSDDTDYVETAFDFCKNRQIVTGNEDKPEEDMALMAACDHNILANSSFSWWGAWLNNNSKKTVIAPKQWFAPETMLKNNTKDLIPSSWIKI